MIKPDFWRMILSSAVNELFFSKFLKKTEQDNLLFSIESFIDEKKMNLDSYARTGGSVTGKRVIFGD